MKIECALFPVLFLLFAICKNSFAISDNQHSPNSRQRNAQQTLSIPDESIGDEKRNGNSVNPRDLMRYLLLTFHPNSAHYRRGAMGIPFRPVRRIGSEFLGKRSVGMPSSEEMEDLTPDKRALGSEFLGKRRLGSEFLGKRSDVDYYDGSQERNFGDWLHHQQQLQPDEMMMLNMEKRRLGSEFLGKRRNDLYDWFWKRGRLGSEFLGKRDSSPAGPEAAGQQEQVGAGELGPREMSQTLDDARQFSN